MSKNKNKKELSEEQYILRRKLRRMLLTILFNLFWNFLVISLFLFMQIVGICGLTIGWFNLGSKGLFLMICSWSLFVCFKPMSFCALFHIIGELICIRNGRY